MSDRRYAQRQRWKLQHDALLEEKNHWQKPQCGGAGPGRIGVQRFLDQSKPLIQQQDAKEQHREPGRNFRKDPVTRKPNPSKM